LNEASDRQRVDKWLWHARLVRTRTAAAALAGEGHVRINGARIDAASRPVRQGDVLTVVLDRRVRVLKVMGFAARRGSANDAATLFEDLAPVAPEPERVSAAPAQRDAGAGRPTKRERRALARFVGETDDLD
jgi:ribosome-associated heat shock protein Hsp15